MKSYLSASTIVAVILGSFGGSAAFAQASDLGDAKNTPVRQRPKPEYAPAGVPMGTFRLYPAVRFGLDYDSNVFAVEHDAESDYAFVTSPKLALSSDWSNHELNARLGAERRQYFDQDDLSYTEYTGGLDGKLDIDRSFYVTGGVEFFDGVEPLQSSPVVADLAKPVDYSRFAADASVVKAFNRYQFTGRVGYSEFDYEDAELKGGGTLSQDTRDRDVTTIGGRGDYFVSPDTALFVEVNHNDREYNPAPMGAVERSSSGYEFLVGSQFELTNLARGEIAVGYFDQSYDAAGVESRDGFDYRAGIDWFVDELVTVGLNASRDIGDAGVDGAVGYVTSSYNLRADYEYRRNWIFSAAAGYSNDDYDEIDREDDRYQVFVSSEYLISRSAMVDVKLAQISQSSDGSVMGREYDVTQLTVGLTFRR